GFIGAGEGDASHRVIVVPDRRRGPGLALGDSHLGASLDERVSVKPRYGSHRPSLCGRWTRRVLACAVWMLVALAPPAVLAADYKTGPAPGWVIATKPGNPTDGQLSKDSDGISYLLVDTQERVGEETSTRYRRLASRALNPQDRKSTRLNSSHVKISYAVFCLK